MAKFYGVKVGRVPGVYTDWASCEAQVKGFQGALYRSFGDKESAESFVNGVPTVETEKPESVSQPRISEEKAEKIDVEELRKKGLEAVDFLQQNNLILGPMADRVRKQVELSCDIKKAADAAMEARDGKPYPTHVNVWVDGSYNAETQDYGYGIYMDDGEKKRILYGRGQCEANGRNVEGEVQASRHALEAIRVNPHYKTCTIYHDYEGIGKWADKEWSANKAYTQAYARFVDKVREHGLVVKFEHVDGHTGVEGNEYVDKLAKVGCGVPLTKSEKEFLEQLKDVPGYPKSLSIDDLPEADKPNQYTLIGDYMVGDFGG